MYWLVRGFRRWWRLHAIVYYLFSQAVVVKWKRRKMPSDPQAAAKMVVEQTRDWARGVVWILGLEIKVEGNGVLVPENGGLVISNHQSYLDILVHAAAGGMCFTPNSGIRKWFFFGWYVGLSNPVWIDRTSPAKAKKTLEEFRRVIGEGSALMLYPEGTTTRGDVPLLNFKSTAFEAVAGTDQAVTMFLTFYRKTDPRDADVQWYDHTGFAKHVWRILGNGRTKVTLVPLPPMIPEAGASRKDLADQAHDRMQQAHTAYLQKMQ